MSHDYNRCVSIIGIAGRGKYGGLASGKSKAAQLIVEIAGGKRFSFADPLKKLAQYAVKETTGEHIDPWKDKNEKVRKLLQRLGTEAMREYDKDIWVKAAMRDVAVYESVVRVSRDHLTGLKKRVPYADAVAVFDDMRFPNELEAVKTNGGITILITVDPDVQLARLKRLYPEVDYEARAQHESETALNDSVFDYQIESWDDERMENSLKEIMRENGFNV